MRDGFIAAWQNDLDSRTNKTLIIIENNGLDLDKRSRLIVRLCLITYKDNQCSDIAGDLVGWL